MDPEKKQIWKKRIVLSSKAFDKWGIPALRLIVIICTAIVSISIMKAPFDMAKMEATYNPMLGAFLLFGVYYFLERRRN